MKSKITLEIEWVGTKEKGPLFECQAEIEHDSTQWKASGTSIGETLLNMIVMIRPTIARKFMFL